MTPDELAAQLRCAELELEIKGYGPESARRAVRRAIGSAMKTAERLRPEIREQAVDDLLPQELAGAERWIQGVQEAATRDDYRRGMERAARDGQYAEGVGRVLGAPVSPEREAAWRSSLADAADAWGQASRA